MKDQKKRLNPYLLVILSFVIIILIGSVLLMFPFSRTANNYGDYVDCLFLATSATCVTGLNCFHQGIATELTFTGQLILLLLIQVGGFPPTDWPGTMTATSSLKISLTSLSFIAGF